MKTHDTRRFRAVGFGVIVVLAAVTAVALVPRGTSAAGPSPSPIPEGCQLQVPQAEAPLTLNVVAMKDLAKTIAGETETFNCFDAQSKLAQVKAVTTVVELTELAKTGHSAGVSTIDKSVQAQTCTKNLNTGRVTCGTTGVALGATDTPLAKCGVTRGTYPFDQVQQPSHPVEMSTVTVGDFVKTVRVEKEVFDCSGQIGDLYLFTEQVETPKTKKGVGFDSVSTTFDGVLCLKNEATAQVSSCKLFTPGKS
jgi:hypothetical protein